MGSMRMGCSAHRDLYVRFDDGTATVTDLEQFDRWVAHCPDCHEVHGLPRDHLRTWQKRLRSYVVVELSQERSRLRVLPGKVLKFPLMFPGPAPQS